MKEQIKETVRTNCANKRIILFGAGEVAEEFYLKYKDKLNISHCVSNYEKEWGENAFLGELDVRPYQKAKLCPNDYLVVCGPIAFRSIEIQLEAEGKKMYIDYVESIIADAILQNKKIALFYGQCILRDIHKTLVKIPTYSNEYASIYTQLNKQQAIITNRLLYYAKDICDLYVYTPKVLDRDAIYTLQKEDFAEDCQVISISNLTCMLYWPQVTTKLREYNDCYLYPYNIIRHNVEVFGHTMYRRADINVNKMVKEKIPSQEIIKRLSEEDYYSERQVMKNKDIVLKSIDMAEKDLDITLGDYITDNYRHMPLYQNFAHPNDCIIWEYIIRLFQKLNIKFPKNQDWKSLFTEVSHQGGDVPIYPSVIKHLQLDFVDERTKYNIMMGDGIAQMTFKEYMEHYVEYTYKAFEILEMIS